jgi:hypothetical protein
MNARGANVLRHPRWRDGDDLARVEDSLRVEDLFQFAKHIDEWAVLLGQKRCSAQAVAVLAADGAAEEPYFFVKLGGERLHRVDIVFGSKIQERPNVQLTLGGVAEDGCSDLQVFERVLDVPQKDGQRLDGDGNVFDAGRGPRRALHAMERGNESLGQPPVQLKVDFVLSNVRRGGQTQFVLDQFDDLVELVPQLVATIGVKFDEQHCLRLAGNQQLITDIGFAREAQVPAIHKIARGRFERGDFQRRVRCLIKTFEQQQHTTPVQRQRVDTYGNLCNQGERAFAAD